MALKKSNLASFQFLAQYEVRYDRCAIGLLLELKHGKYKAESNMVHLF